MRTRSWRCTCGGGHFVTISWIDDECYFTVEDYLAEGMEPSLWTRMKAAWDIVRNRHHLWGEVSLGEQETEEMIVALLGHSDEGELIGIIPHEAMGDTT